MKNLRNIIKNFNTYIIYFDNFFGRMFKEKRNY